MNLLKLLGRDQRGAAAIELALALPVMATLLVGMIDISRGFSAKLQLEQAAQRSIEKAMQAKKTLTLFNTLKAEGVAAAGVAESAVTVEYWLECEGVKKTGASMAAAYETNCDAGETYARYLTVEIQKVYTPMFRTRFAGANANGTYTLKGKAGIRVQ